MQLPSDKKSANDAPNHNSSVQTLVQRLCKSRELSNVQLYVLIRAAHFPQPFEGFCSRLVGEITMPDFFHSDSPTSVSLTDSPLESADCEEAIITCINNGLLRVITMDDQRTIVSQLAEANVVGPLYGLPNCGDLDVTPVGAEIVREFTSHLDTIGRVKNDPVPHRIDPLCIVTVGRKDKFYFLEGEVARFWANSCNSWYTNTQPFDSMFVSEIQVIGRWRRRWWDEYESGYRIEVKAERQDIYYRTLRENQQCRLDDDEHLEETMAPPETNWAPCIQLLAQYGFSLQEWYVFRSVSALPLPLDALVYTLGNRVSDFGPCRQSTIDFMATVTNCINKGFLCVVTPEFLQQIEEVLVGDPAIGPLEDIPLVGTVDFTFHGAALYKKLNVILYGTNKILDADAGGLALLPNRHDQIYLQSISMCQRHFFLNINDALDDLQYSSRRGDGTSDSVLVAGPHRIDRWCIYWWHPFDEGYYCQVEVVHGIRAQP